MRLRVPGRHAETALLPAFKPKCYNGQAVQADACVAASVVPFHVQALCLAVLVCIISQYQYHMTPDLLQSFMKHCLVTQMLPSYGRCGQLGAGRCYACRSGSPQHRIPWVSCGDNMSTVAELTFPVPRSGHRDRSADQLLLGRVRRVPPPPAGSQSQRPFPR